MRETPAQTLRAMLPWLALIGIVIAFDQATKVWVDTALESGGRVAVTPFFDLVLVSNYGAAFSFLADQAGWQRWFFTGLACIVSVWLLVFVWQHRHERLLPAAFALIIGGALGNVIDRILYGAVIDFLSFHIGAHYWPAFNVADSAITLGVALVLVAQFRTQKKSPPEIRS